MSDVVKDSGRSKRQRLKKQIALLKDERSALGVKIESLETRLMAKCPHHVDSLREGMFVPESSSGFGRATPPMRVCIDCGYAEEGDVGIGSWRRLGSLMIQYPSWNRRKLSNMFVGSGHRTRWIWFGSSRNPNSLSTNICYAVGIYPSLRV